MSYPCGPVANPFVCQTLTVYLKVLHESISCPLCCTFLSCSVHSLRRDSSKTRHSRHSCAGQCHNHGVSGRSSRLALGSKTHNRKGHDLAGTEVRPGFLDVLREPCSGLCCRRKGWAGKSPLCMSMQQEHRETVQVISNGFVICPRGIIPCWASSRSHC